jgi:hypothetical protein
MLRPLVLSLALPLALLAAEAPPPDTALVDRAAKIVSKLELADDALAQRTTRQVAQQYASLRAIHEKRDAALKAARGLPDKAAADAATRQARDEATARQSELHYAFVARLSAELTPRQVDQVKDGMTYGVVPLTFGVYQKMMPDLTTEQKTQVLAWLLEAREHAMDAGSSDEKHGWFGKYKGRINNYLSAAGYNLKEAEKNLKK